MAPFIEVVANSTKAERPGYVYVQDTGYDHTRAPLPHADGGRVKRNATVAHVGEAGLTARQNTALAKRLAELEKENSRDLTIPVPTRADGKRSKPKNAATRKIIESARTFAHYLDAEMAMQGNEPDATHAKAKAGVRRQSAMHPTAANDATSSGQSNLPRPRPPTLEELEAPLMRVSVPAPPSEKLMEALTSAPPLSWNDARARPPAPGKPRRHFCEICGYWGRVKCLQCGVRVCGLTCKRAHDDGRCQKYGS